MLAFASMTMTYRSLRIIDARSGQNSDQA